MTPVARVASREGQLKWVIHYLDDHFFYVSRAGARRLTHQSAREGGVIGVLAGSAPLAQLQRGGVTNYLEQTLDTANINMLRMGRIDGWFTSALLLNAAFTSNPELNPADFLIGEIQSSHCVYIVASTATSDAALRPWRQAFATMQADGTVTEILNRYLDQDLRRMLGREKLQTECGRSAHSATEAYR
jgi:ABC-type amino acid transport substrate-binding protein